MNNINEFKLEITGFSSLAEAEAFAQWYSGQGEQNSSIWFGCIKDEGEIEHSTMNCKSITTENNTVKMQLELYE
jgi:hypothetical protein